MHPGNNHFFVRGRIITGSSPVHTLACEWASGWVWGVGSVWFGCGWQGRLDDGGVSGGWLAGWGSRLIRHSRDVIAGGDLSVMFITWGALTVTTVVYFAFVAPSLWTRISPALPVLVRFRFLLARTRTRTCGCTQAETVAQAAWMLLVTYFNLIHASWTDPGIIPRGEKAEVEPDGEYVA